MAIEKYITLCSEFQLVVLIMILYPAIVNYLTVTCFLFMLTYLISSYESVWQILS